MPNSFIFSLIVGSFVGGAASYLGSLMITKRMALVGDALGHVALPGMGLAILLGLDPTLGAFVFLMFGIFFIWKLGEETKLSLETAVGIIFVTSLALGFMIVPEPELLESLIGDISKITPLGMALSLILSAAIIYLVRHLYSGMMLMNISTELAIVEGINTKKFNFLYLMAIAMIISLGIKVTGSLLVGALLIVPPATARLLTDNLRNYIRTSILIGVASSLGGIIVSKVSHLPVGPSIILMGALVFGASFGLKKLVA